MGLKPETQALIERLEKAESGSRELDAAVFKATEPWITGDQMRFMCACTGACNPDGPSYRGACGVVPFYTTSSDAIVALIGEKLPGWNVVINIPPSHQHKHVCELGAPDDPEATIHDPWPFRASAGGANTALAACIALLRALDHQGEGEADDR